MAVRRIDPFRVIMPLVQPVVRVAGKHVNVQVPDVLATDGFVVLSDRGAASLWAFGANSEEQLGTATVTFHPAKFLDAQRIDARSGLLIRVLGAGRGLLMRR